MTIYAIVNNLLSQDALTSDADPIWTLITPSAILQGGNPYFVPDFASRFEACPAMAIRIGKLGKGVAPRFAYRYVEAVAPAVLFVARDMLEYLQEKGLPWTKAISYDRALAIGKFQSVEFGRIEDCTCTLTLQADKSSDKTICSRGPIRLSLEETISSISRDNTLKTGDIILVGLAGEGTQVKPGIRAVLTLDCEDSLRFNIR
ncbi:MAG: fumarylacetoacetate hydrolase family protein [Muribaculaceae bacterium]|nr:fumarylacetoacetate hydrolase family protein [Muribaculaceae bacterium]